MFVCLNKKLKCILMHTRHKAYLRNALTGNGINNERLLKCHLKGKFSWELILKGNFEYFILCFASLSLLQIQILNVVSRFKTFYECFATFEMFQKEINQHFIGSEL